MCHQGAQTGGVGGKKLAIKPAPTSLEAQAARLKISVPITEFIKSSRPMTRYLLHHCLDVARQQGIRVHYEEGMQAPHSVSSRLWKKEARLLAECHLHDREEVVQQLADWDLEAAAKKTAKSKDKEQSKKKKANKKSASRSGTYLVHVDDEEDSGGEEAKNEASQDRMVPLNRAVECIMLAWEEYEQVRGKPSTDRFCSLRDAAGGPKSARGAPRAVPQPATPESRPLELPLWAPAGSVNLRGMMGVSNRHFTAVCVAQVGGKSVCLEGMWDSGASSSLWDL